MSDSGHVCVSILTRIINQIIEISPYKGFIQCTSLVHYSNSRIESCPHFSSLQYTQLSVMSDSGHQCVSFMTRIINQIIEISPYKGFIQVTSLTHYSISSIGSCPLFSCLQYRQLSVMSDSGHPCVSILTRIINQIIEISPYKGFIQCTSLVHYSNSRIESCPLFLFLQYTQLSVMSDSGHQCVSLMTRIINQIIEISPYKGFIQVTSLAHYSNSRIGSCPLYSFPPYTQLPVKSDSGHPCVSFMIRNINQMINFGPFKCLIQVTSLVHYSNSRIESCPLFSFLQYTQLSIMSDSGHQCVSFMTRIINQIIEKSPYKGFIQVTSLAHYSNSRIGSCPLYSFPPYTQLSVMSDSGHPCVSFMTRNINQIINFGPYKSSIQVTSLVHYSNFRIERCPLFSFLQYTQLSIMSDSGHQCISFMTRIINQIIEKSPYKGFIQVTSLAHYSNSRIGS